MKLLNKLIIAIVLSLFCLAPVGVLAKNTFPKTANYYLNFFSARDYDALLRYDLLILQPEMAISQNRFFAKYHKQNPKGKMLAYLYPSSFYRQSLFYDYYGIRKSLYKKINNSNLWLRDVDGCVISPWPQMSAVNLTNKDWQELNLRHLIDNYQLIKKWDGIFWDLSDSEPSRYSTRQINVTGQEYCRQDNSVNEQWQNAMANFLKLAKEKLPNKLSVINGNSLPLWQTNINGRMFEHFPTPWEADGSWQASMQQYLYDLPKLNNQPLYILNVRYDKNLKEGYFQQMRFGLTSALLGDGYFSFDNGSSSHSQLWWFDEYDLSLGKSVTKARNISKITTKAEPGLWIREFDNGLVLVNSSDIDQDINLTPEKFMHFYGRQDQKVNNGQAVNYLTLKPRDGVILIKR